MSELRIVQGNNFGTAIKIEAVDASGHEIQDFSLAGSTNIRVWYVYGGKEVEIEAWTIEDERVLILWPKDLRFGTYDLFQEGMFGQTAWRNSMKSQFTIVKYNYEANIPDDVIVLNGIYHLSAQMAIITRIEGGGGGGIPSDDDPLMDGTASPGTDSKYSRGDHRHPTDTTRQEVIDDLQTIREGAAAGATAYQLPSTGISKTDLASGVQTSLGKADSAVQPAAISDMATESYVSTAVGAEETRAKGVEGGLQDAIDLINAKIPSAASAQNQLADKNWVNSSISTNTATFKGTYNSLADLQQVTATNNDYAFVIETDSVGNEYYDRYKYVTGTGWVYEYKVESTPFTSDQWEAIQSGITSALVTKLSALPTDTELTTALNGKQPTIDSTHKLDYSLIDNTPTIPAAQVNSDWNAASGVAQILNKPTIPTALSQLTEDTTHRVVTDTEKATWNGKADKVLVNNHGTSDTTYSVTPNVFHIWGTVGSLTLTLATPTDATIVNEYMIEFVSGSTATTLSLPSSVEWAESCGALSVEASKTYQISIVNNIGLWASISNS